MQEDSYEDEFQEDYQKPKGQTKTYQGSNRHPPHQTPYNPAKFTELKTLDKQILILEQQRYNIEENARKVANMKRIVDETIKLLYEQGDVTYLGDLRRMVRNSSTEEEVKIASDMLLVISRFNGSLEDYSEE